MVMSEESKTEGIGSDAFLMRNKRLIAVSGLIGLFFSITYVVLTKNKYEARAQIQMAQFVSTSGENGARSINIEEPAALVQRLRTPTTYTLEAQKACNVSEEDEVGEYLNGILKGAVVKNVAHVVEIKVVQFSPEKAKKCAEAIVEMITLQQHNQIEARMAALQIEVEGYQLALLREQQQLEGLKKSELGNFGYLARLDQLSWLRARIDSVNEQMALSKMYPSKLLSPIYIPKKPVSPMVGISCLLGIILGLVLGVLYALWRDNAIEH